MKYLMGWLIVFSQGATAFTVGGPGLKGWATTKLPIYVNYTNCPLSNAEMDDLVAGAIGVWNQVPTAGLTLSRAAGAATGEVAPFLAGKATQVPVILCDPKFSTSTKGIDPNVIPAYTPMPRKYPLQYGGIVLNAQKGARSYLANFDPGQRLIIVAHEMGHVLGLGHSQQLQALMYASLANKKTAVLSEDDEMGISHLYPRNEFTSGPFGCAAVHGAEKEEVPSVLIWILGALSTVMWARRTRTRRADG